MSKNATDNGSLGKFRAWKVPAWASRAAALTVNIAVLLQVQYYCTDALGLAPGLVGMVLMASKLFDGFSDLIAGFIIDKTHAYACQLAVELGKKKVRVNAVLPGSTDTGMKDEFAEMAGGLENMIRFAGKAGRLATSEEVAMPIVFLGSDMAKFVSGEELIVDFCDNAMKKTGLKPEICGAPAL